MSQLGSLNTLDMDQLMQELAQLSPGDLQDVMDEEQNKTDSVPDGHLIKYLDACREESFKNSEDRRDTDKKLWAAHETQMEELNDKEDWQSRIVLNKPFMTCIQAKSMVRHGLVDKPNFFALETTDQENPQSKLLAEFWEKDLRYWLGTDDAYLPNVFADSTEMGFGIGQSMVTKIIWEPDEHGIYRLKLVNFPYWHTFPDPDREPRKPWSGLYNIHEEWVDFHTLREQELLGHYQNVDQVRVGRAGRDGSGYRVMAEEAQARRVGMRNTQQRNPYRNAVLLQELWGTILDENSESTMTNATFTVANGVVVRAVRQNRCRRLRWPWLDYAPLPHVIHGHGYGLYESSLALWKFQNNLLNLYIDNENWRINNMFEIDLSKLDNPNDLEIYPLKKWIKKRSADGPAITPVLKGENNLADVEFMWQLMQTAWDNGTFITEFMSGQTGDQRKKTATEISLKLQQSIGVFDSIGKDCERGCEQLIWAVKEMLITFQDDFNRPGFKDLFAGDPVWMTLQQAGALHPLERMDALDLDCQVRVKGVSRLFRQSDELNRMKELFAMVMTMPEVLMQYLKPYKSVKKFSEELNQDDLILSEQEVQQQQQMQRQQMIQQAVGGALMAAEGKTPTGTTPQPATGGPPGATSMATSTAPSPA
jgi:hypothetical protein